MTERAARDSEPAPEARPLSAEEGAVPMPEGARVLMLDSDLALFELPVPRPRRLDALTSAEQDVAFAVFEGASNREIARARGVSVKTVGNQLERIYRKVGVASRMELILVIRAVAGLDDEGRGP